MPGSNSVNIQDHIDALKFRLKLCDRTLTSTNMILAYLKLEDVFVYYYKNELIKDLTGIDSKISKFDKMKTLALGNKNIGERKVAFNMSVKLMDRLLGGIILDDNI
jgi:hypothetical protein